MAREHEGLVSVVNRRKMSQYIHTYHQGGVMKTDFENVKVKKQGQPTVESLKSEQCRYPPFIQPTQRE